MPTVAQALTELVTQAAVQAGFADGIDVMEPCVPTNDAKNGDYQSNFAFRLGKSRKMNPRAVADALKGAFPANTLLAEPPTVAGPGFLNFKLSDAWLANDVAARAVDPALGAERSGAGRAVVIDYSSPNIAKRMHVGHLRSTVIGAALHRLYDFLGWTVVADNHIGDWGTQFGRLMVAWRRWLDAAAFADDPIGELQRLYVLFGDRAKEDAALEDLARAETAKLQEGDPENRALWQQFCDVSMTEFNVLYARMGIRFDVVHGESYYREELQPLVDDLLARGLAEVSDGAVILPLGDVEPRFAENPMLIRKRDGAALYATTDLATVRHRIATWSPARIVYVTDIRQRLHFEQVFVGARKVGLLPEPAPELVHVGFGMLRLPDGGIVATRTGTGGSLNLKDVLDTAVAHARTVVDAKSGHLPDEERAHIAEAVGVGAIRYADLSQNPQSDITFAWDKILSLDGNTAPALMYAYARSRSLFRKAEVDFDTFTPRPLRLDHPSERALAIAIARTPEAIVDAARTSRPNVVADHLFGLSNALGRFYDDCRVNDAALPDEVRASRLTLVYATARALAAGMALLGLQPLDRM